MSTPSTISPHSASGRQGSTRATVDLLVVCGGYGVAHLVLGAMGNPIVHGSMAAAVSIATWRLWSTGQQWRRLGMSRPASWGRTVAEALALYGLAVVLTLLLVEPLATALDWDRVDLDAFKEVQQSTAGLLQMLPAVWTIVAFGEEMVFRGFLLMKLSVALSRFPFGPALAILLQATIFALGHAPLGIHGMACAFLVGVVFGTWFLCGRRNLWPLIFAHGLIDTLSLVALNAGLWRG